MSNPCHTYSRKILVVKDMNSSPTPLPDTMSYRRFPRTLLSFSHLQGWRFNSLSGLFFWVLIEVQVSSIAFIVYHTFTECVRRIWLLILHCLLSPSRYYTLSTAHNFSRLYSPSFFLSASPHIKDAPSSLIINVTFCFLNDFVQLFKHTIYFLHLCSRPPRTI